MDILNRTPYEQTVDALRSMQPVPPIQYNSNDWIQPLILGQQPPVITEAKGIVDLAHEVDPVSFQAVHIPLGDVGRATGAAFYAPRPNENSKTWPAFINGIGRSTLANENSLFGNMNRLQATYNQAFTGDVQIRNRQLLQVPLRVAYTKDELFQAFGAPTICKDGVLCWYAYHASGKGTMEKEIYFSWDPQMQAYVPRYTQGDLVYPEMWNTEELINKPQRPGLAPRNTMGEEDVPQYDPGLPMVSMPAPPMF